MFHYFNFTELTAFKAYTWCRTIWGLPEFQDRQFSLNQIKGIKRYQKKILRHYDSVPGSEIWGTDSLSITLLQIEYYLTNDMFKVPEEALVLCQQLKALFEHLYQMTTHGKKFAIGTTPGVSAPDFSFYHNQLSHSNSFLLVNSPIVNSCFVTVDNLHTVKSREPLFYQFMKNWKLRLIEQSIAIGPNAKRDRNKFFNHIEKQLAVFEKKINKHLKG